MIAKPAPQETYGAYGAYGAPFPRKLVTHSLSPVSGQTRGMSREPKGLGWDAGTCRLAKAAAGICFTTSHRGVFFRGKEQGTYLAYLAYFAYFRAGFISSPGLGSAHRGHLRPEKLVTRHLNHCRCC
jgi:hypothetical protein